MYRLANGKSKWCDLKDELTTEKKNGTKLAEELREQERSDGHLKRLVALKSANERVRLLQRSSRTQN